MKVLKYIALSLIILIIAFVSIELCYRFQVFDFYSSEFNNLNDSLPEKYDKTILVFGDSFTAQHNGYVDMFRKEVPKIRFINAALPENGINKINLIGHERIEQSKPDVIVLQINPFNEFRSLQKSMNSNNFKVLDYYNDNCGKTSEISPSDVGMNSNEEFDINNYDRETKDFVAANPHFIEYSAHLSDSSFHSLFKEYDKQLENFIQQVDTNIPIYLLVIPHCSQVGDKYYEQFTELGAILPEKSIHFNDDYEFCKQLFLVQSKYNNVKLVNLIPFLKNYQLDPGDVYYDNNPNLNALGNKSIYDILSYIFVYHEVIKY